MGQFWTRKKDDDKDKETFKAEDFFTRVTKHKEDNKVESQKVDNTKLTEKNLQEKSSKRNVSCALDLILILRRFQNLLKRKTTLSSILTRLLLMQRLPTV